MESGAKKSKKLHKLPLYIIGGTAIVLYVALTIDLLCRYFNFGKTEVSALSAILLNFIVVLVITPCYFAVFALFVAGLVVSIITRKKKGLSIWWIIGFAIMIAVTIVTFVLVFTLYIKLGPNT